ncbi:MAG: hypothetical protein HQL51_12340 [Magnetococcales bacterium]|nr:hypothetical protein [Magnetococcales bacterium]
MSRAHRRDPLESLIRRSLRNGIKTMGGVDHRVNPTLGPVRVLTWMGDRQGFLAILQADAAQLDHRFDLGQNTAEFVALVTRIADELANEST